ncbi:MAG: hypothetical protein ACK4Q5_16355, partial [Saprospiraceae bacterium]
RGSFSLSAAGYTDYKYDQVFFGRNEESGSIFAQQTAEAEGGFKYGLGSRQAQRVGHSNKMLMALNLKLDLPRRLPILGYALKPYFDFGVARRSTLDGAAEPPEEVFWSAGFAFELFNGNFGIYFPVHNSKNLNDLYKQAGGNYARQIGWRINLNGLEPRDMMLRLLP